tara:strand:- start:423 stop:599 length:177 start_codon:yes stop_codon:yes gene_type:complete
MKKIAAVSLIFFLTTAGCIGPNEKTSSNQSYTNSPKDRGQDAWRALEPVNYEIKNDAC